MMRLVRFLMLFAVGLFFMAVFRTFMGAVKSGLTHTTASTPAKPEQVANGGELKKCAVCGTYNAVLNSVTRRRGGETIYYCSNDCRARHAA
jgi:hypothetical protein